MQGEKGVKLQGTMSDSALARALALVRDLRARCPWDRAQTPQTLRPYLVEEVLELDQALKHDDAAALRDELGDLLLHLAFQIVIGEERDRKSTRLNSSHSQISYAVFCLKKKKNID